MHSWESGHAESFKKRSRVEHSIVVPITVLEESNRLSQRRNVVHLNVSFRRWANELEHFPNFQVQAYTLEILLESVALIALRDPADRAIMAKARDPSAVLSSPPMK